MWWEERARAGRRRPARVVGGGSGDFGQRGLDVVGGGEFGARERRREQRVVGEQIDLARQPAGGLVDCFFGGGIEERDLGAGEAEAMREIAGELLAGERGHVIADDDALRERLVHGHGEAPTQFGLAEQEQAQARLGIHLIVGEQAEILEDIGAEVVRFVDDEDGPGAGVGAEARHLRLDLPVERGAGAFDAQPHLPGDGLEEIHHVAGGERHIEDAIETGVELGEDAARGAGLAAAAVAGDQADAAQVEQMREADVELATAGGGEEFVGRRSPARRDAA